MKKIIVFGFCLILFYGCNEPVQNIANSSYNISASEASFTKIDEKSLYEIDLVYPVIDGDLSNDVLNKINNTIAEEFNTFSNQKEFIESHQEIPLDFNSKNPEWRGTLENSYGISQCDSILNIWFSFHRYFLGAAHGFSNNYSLQFNLNSGEQLNVSHFFKTDSESLASLKSIINTSLPDNECWGIEADSNLLPILQNFIFSTDSISFLIDDYALCPYALGVGILTFPKSSFIGLLTPSSNGKCTDVSVIHDQAEIATH